MTNDFLLISMYILALVVLWLFLDYCVFRERSLLVKLIKAVMPKQRGGSRMKNRIAALRGIGTKARAITTEIAGNYAICVATEPATKKKNLCVYASAKGLSFADGAVHSRTLVKAFPYTSEEELVKAHKDALVFLARKEGKIATEVGDEIEVQHNGKTVKAKVTHVA